MKDLAQAEEDEAQELVAPKTLKQRLWGITKLVLKFAVTAALLYYVFSKVPLQKVKLRLIHANYWWMLAALVCFFLSMIMSSWRLSSFFKSIKLKLDPRFNFRLYLLGLFYNFLLPGGIGGDGYKIYLLNKTYKLPAKKVFWAIMFDRLSGLWAIGLITVALIFLIPQIDIHIGIPLSIFVVASLIYYFVAYKFFREYTHYFWQAHLKALVVQSLQVTAIVFILFGQDFTGKFSPYLLSFLISALATIIPISVGGAGIRETVFQQLTKVFPMDVDLAVFLPISFYLISIIVALSGIYYVLRPSRLEEGLPKTEDNLENQQA
ncbi:MULTISPECIES: lysylphosphatidylglycerol synthase transmembrane domain-containing protein [unclassified Mucilaginibacter]|uniref:lysylphosphatidylglycerol synthase transmembrane domain-containing protein n=1 Tax=unclassified Mucilaginibacter TaxID=2617802 RepID=UPI002AC8C6B7|nr:MULTISPECIES: lysylphosphatidylglycerol synthase transmembrane domain-containing protein [unclassified Mucilaginibacter]MEB0262385.1 lysylphosphatidylglycerol synthase transmembrane domain-containing protein [Mucilaginibacter sp. 10I4]MEB0277958.1 lysylphosphatidylglycerol synthase transmembrane domain-containing protein [Mucilaginibacter sp. 10B2]MEB0299689.1 lysylphosphatidylglycerol synthase transmembrane domain-containing protein [Mucilaginibacter sp. 5C4]WPX22849.1 lysylphosphatidylglyc